MYILLISVSIHPQCLVSQNGSSLISTLPLIGNAVTQPMKSTVS